MRTATVVSLGVGALAVVVLASRPRTRRAVAGVLERAAEFVQTVSESMAEREAQLRAELGMDQSE